MELVDQDVPGPRRVFPGYGRRQPKVVWPNGAKVAVNLVVNYEEGSEYSKPAGDGRNEGLAEIPYVMDARVPRPLRGVRLRVRQPCGDLAAHAAVRRVRRQGHVLRVRVALERNPEVGQWIQRGRPRAVLATAGAGPSTGSSTGSRSASTCSGRSSPSSAPAASARSAGTAATARASTRASSSSRRAGSSTTRTPTTTTCPTSPRSRASGTSSSPTR